MNDRTSEYSLGIDIGGTNTKFGVTDRSGNVVYKNSISTKDHTDPENLLKEIYKEIQAGTAIKPEGVGIGAPNGNYFKGTIEHAPNLPWPGIVPLAAIAEKIFSLPVVLTNDANAAALGEMIFGKAKGMKDFIMITLGTGVGSGIVANGELLLGHSGLAGELGHVIVVPNGRLHPGTGLHGSLESYAGAAGITESAGIFLKENNNSSLVRFLPAELTVKQVFEAALGGDEVALKVFNFTAEILGSALANFALFSAPEAIILFGGIVQSDKFVDAVYNEMEQRLLPSFRNKIKLIRSGLPESDAAILGAASLVFKKKRPA